MDARSSFYQAIARVLTGVMLLNPLLSTAAELTLDATAGGNTQLGQAANGVPIVNIATPNSNGLSHNHFSDYNVGAQGLILNNATGATQSTALGGIILGNSNLNGHAAALILNEVTGANQSQLRGYTEVAGQSAHVVVANPHGITCDGCGFINTPHATLSTGKPIVANGRLQFFDVDGGEIRIEGAGVNASNVSQFDLITRSASLNAELHARQLNIITGRNLVDARTLTATAKADDGSAQPSLAIDSSALGGMYAGAIRLVGTEAGVGVNLAGDMAASAGDIQIDANGHLSLARSAARDDLRLSAASIELNGDAYAGGHARLNATDDIYIAEQQRLAAAGDVRLTAQVVENWGDVESGRDQKDGLNPASTLRIETEELYNLGQVTAHGALEVQAQSLDNQHGTLLGSQAVELEVAELDNRNGQIIAQQTLSLSGVHLDNRDGAVASNQTLAIDLTGRLDNRDDGLLFSSDGGLSVVADEVKNTGGTVQSDHGALLLSASSLNNRHGSIATRAGALQLQVANIDNQQGSLLASGGALSSNGEWLSNQQGWLQGDSLDLTTREALNNDAGKLIATLGNARIDSADTSNIAGQLLAQGDLLLSGASLNNDSGTLGAQLIDLALTDALANSNGLIEASQTLQLQAAEVDNEEGQLRALGENGASRIQVQNHFGNSGGQVEIGNASFSLSSASLNNSHGSILHLGDQGFALNVADLDAAGGRLITNSDLTLSAASWFNTSLLQARNLTLNIGQLSQGDDGQLIATHNFSGTGADWVSDGLLASDGDFRLNLSSGYSGYGDIISLGDMHLSAASLRIGEGIDIRSGGRAQLDISGNLYNEGGHLRAAGGLLINAAELDNHGSLGSASYLQISAPSLFNQGLLYSGTDMALYSTRLTNQYGDIYSLGRLLISKNIGGEQAELLENRSGSIESVGDMSLRAAVLENRKEHFALGRQQTYGRISVTCYDCSGDHHNVDYIATERFDAVLTSDSPAARIHSGGDLAIEGGAVSNLYSSLSASGAIALRSDTLLNLGAESGVISRVQRFNTGRVTDGTDERFRDNTINPYNAQALPKVLPSALDRWNLLSDIETFTPDGMLAPAVIQAGGALTIQADQGLSNGTVSAFNTPLAGAEQQLNTQVTGNQQTLQVRLNPQLPPDLSQQVVNPLSLPGFSLPSGHGLFQLSLNPAHPYLIETNPAFASLSNFLNSDYLLSRLGYSTDEMQRRLGDGLYEQRLIQQAITARTGQRFLYQQEGAGLNSDEAMFRYLMDNAIASKEELQLSVGVALTAEQVAALTHDIVWMQEQEVKGQKVLVPVLYLAQANDRLAPTGALIQGRDVALISGAALNNSGTLRATQNLSATANRIDNSGLMQANERLSLLATDSIRNAQGGIIAGKDVSAIALTGDMSNERTISEQQRSGRGYSQLTSVVDNAARIEATGKLTLAAGGDLHNIGGSLTSGDNANLSAGGDVVIAAASEEQAQMRKDKRHFWNNATTTQHGADVLVGGNLQVNAGQDLAIIASTIKAAGDIELDSVGDTTISSTANQTSSEYHYKRSDKQVDKEDSRVTQHATVIEAGGDLDIHAGHDLTIVASSVSGAGNVALNAEQDIHVLSSKDEATSFYAKSSESSFGRSKSQQKESYDSSNVASLIEAGVDLTINSSKAADGAMSIDGGRDVNIIGSQLKAGNDLLVGATGDVAILSGIEEHGAYAKKSESGFLGLSTSGKSQLQTRATQVASELYAGHDAVIAAGNDIRLRASQASASNDVELRAGLVERAGDINLVSANDTAYSLSKSYQSKVGLSSSSNVISIASAKQAGNEAQSSTSVGSQVTAERDATLQAERDINVVGSGVSAGRNVTLGAGRDVNVLAAQNSQSNSSWQTDNKTGIALSNDSNGVSVFIGKEKLQESTQTDVQTAAASQLQAGQDVSIQAGRDINQQGSAMAAGRDIRLQATRDITLDAAAEALVQEESQTTTRNGLTGNISHNYGNTKDAVNGAGKGDNNVSKGSSSLKAVDAVSQFVSGPSMGGHLGSASQTNSSSEQTLSNRASTLDARRDISAVAGNALTVSGSQLTAGRDISLAGKDVTLDVARGATVNDRQEVLHQGGINGGTAGGIKAGVGGSYGEAAEAQTQGTALPTQLQAGRYVELKAAHDLSLIGTQIQAEHDIDLNAGHDLNIQAAGNEFDDESKRHSGGGEVGLAVGSGGIGVYASINLGKGQLEREGDRQQEAYLYAGDRLEFTSGQDTTIGGATLRGDEVIGRVGGDLNVSSLPDTGNAKGREFDISATVTVGAGASASGSVGYGKTTGKTNWVEEQTSITAKDRLDIRSENHTQLDGALLASDSGNLKLDTGTLGYRDINGQDQEHGYYLNVGGSYSFSSGQAQGADGKTVALQDVSQQGKGTEGANGWSVSGYDYRKDREQIVRATVGAGDIVVRGDAQTGPDSTAGLNRDVDKAYEVTKDEEERTDLYASQSSIEAVRHPNRTLEQWKEGVSNYGLNAALAFDNFGQLGKQAEKSAKDSLLFAALAWGPELLIDAMNRAGTFTGGVFPSPENYGGALTQLPVLLTGDLMAKRVIASFQRDEHGQIKMEKGKPVLDEESVAFQEFSNLEDKDKVFTNGILNGLMEAVTNGVMQSDSEGIDFVLAYNPTHGLIGDLLESGFDSLSDGKVQSGTARNLSGIFQQGIDDGVTTTRIYGHSQGGLLTWVAVKDLDFTKGGTQVQMGSIQLSGAPVDAVAFGSGAEKIGFREEAQHAFQVNRPDETVFFGLLPKTDSVADMPLLGGNAQYSSDPVALTLGSIFSLVNVLGFGESPHSNYACVTCEAPAPGSAAAQIRDLVVKPTMIDEHGNAQRVE